MANLETLDPNVYIGILSKTIHLLETSDSIPCDNKLEVINGLRELKIKVYCLMESTCDLCGTSQGTMTTKLCVSCERMFTVCDLCFIPSYHPKCTCQECEDCKERYNANQVKIETCASCDTSRLVCEKCMGNGNLCDCVICDTCGVLCNSGFENCNGK